MIKSLLNEVNRFINSDSKKILKNIGWLFFDRVFRMGIGLVVGAWVARYLGPTLFGTFNFSLATIGIFSAFATVGIESLVVKELVENPQRIASIMSTAFTIRFLAGLFSFFICIGIFFFLKYGEPEAFYVGCVLSLTLLAQALVGTELYFQSQVASKTAVIAQSIAYILMNALKVVFILTKADLLAFAVVTTLEMALGGLFMTIAYTRLTKKRITFFIDKALARNLLSKGWPLMFSAFMIMIYMRIDQIMLGEMVNDYEVGTYSAALKLSEIWYIIPTIICNSFFPSIIEAKKISQEAYLKRIQKLLDVLFVISFGIALFVAFTSNIITDVLYGSQFKDAAFILAIHIWTSIFVFLGVGANNFLIIENLQIKTFTRTALGAVLNIILNLILIPKFLAVGAAVATLISQACSSFVFDLLSRKTYVLFKMKTRSLLGVNIIKGLLSKGTNP